ncbi:MAG: hypothetical protein JXR96_26695 [Deltaproteobacteria bacterium]|nr:hypothetical protein [Deltaproteobacteria bacterium]
MIRCALALLVVAMCSSQVDCSGSSSFDEGGDGGHFDDVEGRRDDDGGLSVDGDGVGEDGGDFSGEDGADGGDADRSIFEEIWRADRLSGQNVLPAAVDDQNNVYVVAGDCDLGVCPYTLYRIDPHGNIVWSLETGGPCIPLIDSEGRIVISIMSGDKFMSVDREGEVVCEVEIDREGDWPFYFAGQALGIDGSVFVAWGPKILGYIRHCQQA